MNIYIVVYFFGWIRPTDGLVFAAIEIWKNTEDGERRGYLLRQLMSLCFPPLMVM